AGRSEQLPQYSVIRNSGHAFGDFVFTRSAGSPEPATASLPELAAPPAVVGKQLNSSRPSTVASNSLAQKQSFGSGYQAGAAMGQSGASPGLPQSQATTQPSTSNAAVQRFAVVHYGLTEAEFCVGWLTIQPGAVQYHQVQGNHGSHSFEFPFASIKEAKKNAV